MTTHTDRIRQMAREAGIQSPEQCDGHSQDCPWMATTDELTRFAQLVAEDCARVAGALLEGCHKRSEYDEYSPSDAQTIGWIDGVDESQKRIRARYSLKD